VVVVFLFRQNKYIIFNYNITWHVQEVQSQAEEKQKNEEKLAEEKLREGKDIEDEERKQEDIG